jgi:hypothetical protein
MLWNNYKSLILNGLKSKKKAFFRSKELVKSSQLWYNVFNEREGSTTNYFQALRVQGKTKTLPRLILLASKIASHILRAIRGYHGTSGER